MATRKKTVCGIFVAAVLLCTLIAAEAQSQNLLNNSGFENLGEDGALVAWKRDYRYPIKNTAGGIGGGKCLQLKTEVPQGKSYRNNIVQRIGKLPSGDYILSGYFKGDISALWIVLSFREKIEKGNKQYKWLSKDLFQESEHAGWWRFAIKINVPEGTKQGILLLAPFSYKKDTIASFDDIKLIAQPKVVELVFSEDFSSGTLSPEWEKIRGDWKIENNALCGKGVSTGAIICFSKKLGTTNMRLEYTAWTDKNPCDLSALLCHDPSKKGLLNGYFFGFGSHNNTMNKIIVDSKVLAENGGVWESFTDGIKPGVKHKVAVERRYNQLSFFIDGKRVLEGNDVFFSEKTGECFGFYIWNQGYIDDIKVYSLAASEGEMSVVDEKKIEFQLHEGFEKYSLNERPSGFKAYPENMSIKTVDRPTWIFKKPFGTKYVKDQCLEINSVQSVSGVKISTPFHPLTSGIIEFDILAEEYKELKMSVSDKNGQDILNLIISEEGGFFSENENERKLLKDSILYQRRAISARLRFIKDRWYTFRLFFDNETGLRKIIIMDHYTELKEDYPAGLLGEYLPLSIVSSGKVNNKGACFAIESKGKSRLYLDNLVIFGPVGMSMVNRKPINFLARKLLDLEYPLRKDPFKLKWYSQRHIGNYKSFVTPLGKKYRNKTAPKYKYFKKAAGDYNKQLLDLAFFEEQINMLERTLFYSKKSITLHNKLEPMLKKNRNLISEAEGLQDNALKSFARAYLSDNDETLLESDFYPVCAEIKTKHESIDRAIKTCLEMLLPESASKSIIPCPSPVERGKITWNRTKKRWEKNNRPSVYNHFACHIPEELFTDDMRMLGYTYPHTGFGANPFGAKEGTYLPEYFYRKGTKEFKAIKGPKASDSWPRYIYAISGTHYATMYAPKWWYEKHKGEDIIFCQNNGEPFKTPFGTSKQYMLNYWHPEVKKLIQEQFGAVGKLVQHYERTNIKFFMISAEGKNMLPEGNSPGYNKSAIRIFRETLKSKYRTIENLNSLWNTEYKNFNEINPPRYKTKPSGLQYEFRKFVSEGYCDWLRSITDAFHKYAPGGIPTAADMQDTLGGSHEPVGFFKGADIKLYHTYQKWDRKIVDRWHHQLSKALNVPFGTIEWTPAQGSPYMFDLEKIRNNGLRERFMQPIWGAIMLDSFAPFAMSNWQYKISLHEPRLGWLVFNYTAPYTAIYMDRIRRMCKEEVLSAPTVKSEIGILEATSSYFNNLKVREGIKKIAIELSETGWDFEFLYEKTLNEKLQDLKGTELLFVPSGLCMTEDLKNLLYKWVKSGGTMFCTGGPAGILNEYGQPSKNLLNSLFNAEWKELKGGEWELKNTKPFYSKDGVKAWKTVYGKGTIIVFNTWKVNKDIFKMMESYTEKSFGSDNKNMQFCLRKKDGIKYLYILNWSVDKKEQGQIFLKGKYRSVIDKGLQVPLEIPQYYKDGKTFFQIQLAPAEGTLIQLK